MLFSDAEGRISTTPPQISFLDHGFLFGDSLYEVVRVYDRKLFGWNEHIERFIKSGERVGIDVAPLVPEMRKRAAALLTELQEPSAAFRIVLSRGVGRLHIDWRSCSKPAIYMAAWKFDVASLPKSISLAVVNIRRNDIRALDPAIKSGNYLNSVLAFKEAAEYGFDDAIFLNLKGHITELTTMNIGWIKDDKVFTPATSTGILHGVTRRILCEHAKVLEGEYPIQDLETADEVFVLSTFKEVLPVSKIRFESGKIQEYRSTQKTLELLRVLQAGIQKRLSTEVNFF